MAGPSSRTGVAMKFDVNGSPRSPPLQALQLPGLVDPGILCSSASSGRDREFESPSLQRGVWCEPDFRGRIPSMTVGDFANANPSAALARGTERQRITTDHRADNC